MAPVMLSTTSSSPMSALDPRRSSPTRSPNGPWICSTSSANGALGSKARRAAADAVGWNASGLVSMRSARCSTSLDLRAPPNPEKMAESSSLTTLWRFLASLRSTVNFDGAAWPLRVEREAVVERGHRRDRLRPPRLRFAQAFLPAGDLLRGELRVGGVEDQPEAAVRRHRAEAEPEVQVREDVGLRGQALRHALLEGMGNRLVGVLDVPQPDGH